MIYKLQSSISLPAEASRGRPAEAEGESQLLAAAIDSSHNLTKMRAMSFSLCVAGASAHGMMTYPPTRFPNAGPGYPGLFPNGSVLWFNQGCSIGCKAPSGDTCSKFKPNGYSSACCEEPMEPTLNSDGAGGPNSPSLSPRTYNDAEEAGVGHFDITKYNPWRAPGHAPVADPCGIAGGWGTPGAPGNGGVPPPGFKQGDRGSTLPPVKTPTVWKAGGVATVAWGMVANHGAIRFSIVFHLRCVADK